jgi:hypothetical protein
MVVELFPQLHFSQRDAAPNIFTSVMNVINVVKVAVWNCLVVIMTHSKVFSLLDTPSLIQGILL